MLGTDKSLILLGICLLAEPEAKWLHFLTVSNVYFIKFQSWLLSGIKEKIDQLFTANLSDGPSDKVPLLFFIASLRQQNSFRSLL